MGVQGHRGPREKGKHMTLWVLVTDGVPVQWFSDSASAHRALAVALSSKDRAELWPVEGA